MMPHIESQAQRDALISDCKADIAQLEKSIARYDALGPVEWLSQCQSQLLRQQIVLNALEAEPFAYARKLVRIRDGGIEAYKVTQTLAENTEGLLYRNEVTPLYPAPPVSVLKPVNLTDCDFAAVSHMSGGSNDYCNGFVDGVNHAAKQVSAAGYPIAGADNNHIPDAG